MVFILKTKHLRFERKKLKLVFFSRKWVGLKIEKTCLFFYRVGQKKHSVRYQKKYYICVLLNINYLKNENFR